MAAAHEHDNGSRTELNALAQRYVHLLQQHLGGREAAMLQQTLLQEQQNPVALLNKLASLVENEVAKTQDRAAMLHHTMMDFPNALAALNDQLDGLLNSQAVAQGVPTVKFTHVQHAVREPAQHAHEFALQVSCGDVRLVPALESATAFNPILALMDQRSALVSQTECIPDAPSVMSFAQRLVVRVPAKKLLSEGGPATMTICLYNAGSNEVNVAQQHAIAKCVFSIHDIVVQLEEHKRDTTVIQLPLLAVPAGTPIANAHMSIIVERKETGIGSVAQQQNGDASNPRDSALKQLYKLSALTERLAHTLVAQNTKLASLENRAATATAAATAAASGQANANDKYAHMRQRESQMQAQMQAAIRRMEAELEKQLGDVERMKQQVLAKKDARERELIAEVAALRHQVSNANGAAAAAAAAGSGDSSGPRHSAEDVNAARSIQANVKSLVDTSSVLTHDLNKQIEDLYDAKTELRKQLQHANARAAMLEDAAAGGDAALQDRVTSMHVAQERLLNQLQAASRVNQELAARVYVLGNRGENNSDVGKTVTTDPRMDTLISEIDRLGKKVTELRQAQVEEKAKAAATPAPVVVQRDADREAELEAEIAELKAYKEAVAGRWTELKASLDMRRKAMAEDRDKLAAKITSLEAEREKSEAHMSGLHKAEKQVLREQLTNLRAELARMDAALKKSGEEVDERREELRNAASKLSDMQSIHQQAQLQAEEERAQLHNKLTLAAQATAAAEARGDKVSNDLARAEEIAAVTEENLSRQVSEAEEEAARLKSQLAQVACELEVVTKNLSEREDELDELSRELNNERASHARREAELRDEIEDLENRRDALREELIAVRTESAKHAMEAKASSASLKEQLGIKDELQRELTALQSLFAERSESLTATASKLDEQNKAYVQLEQEKKETEEKLLEQLARLRDRVRSMTGNVKELERVHAMAEREVEEEEKEFQTLIAERDEQKMQLEGTKATLQARIDALEAEFEELHIRHDAAADGHAKRNARLTDEQAISEKLATALQESVDEHARLEEEYEAERAALQGEIDALQERAEAIIKEHTEAVTTSANLLEKKQRRLHDTLEELRVLRKERDEAVLRATQLEAVRRAHATSLRSELLTLNDALLVLNEWRRTSEYRQLRDKCISEARVKYESLSTYMGCAYVKGVGNGPRLKRVVKGSPAYKAGLRKKDVIESINGKAVRTRKGFRRAVAKCSPGETAVLSVRRGQTVKRKLPAIAFKNSKNPLGGEAREVLLVLGARGMTLEETAKIRSLAMGEVTDEDLRIYAQSLDLHEFLGAPTRNHDQVLAALRINEEKLSEFYQMFEDLSLEEMDALQEEVAHRHEALRAMRLHMDHNMALLATDAADGSGDTAGGTGDGGEGHLASDPTFANSFAGSAFATPLHAAAASHGGLVASGKDGTTATGSGALSSLFSARASIGDAVPPEAPAGQLGALPVSEKEEAAALQRLHDLNKQLEETKSEFDLHARRLQDLKALHEEEEGLLREMHEHQMDLGAKADAFLAGDASQLDRPALDAVAEAAHGPEVAEHGAIASLHASARHPERRESAILRTSPSAAEGASIRVSSPQRSATAYSPNRVVSRRSSPNGHETVVERRARERSEDREARARHRRDSTLDALEAARAAELHAADVLRAVEHDAHSDDSVDGGHHNPHHHQHQHSQGGQVLEHSVLPRTHELSSSSERKDGSGHQEAVSHENHTSGSNCHFSPGDMRAAAVHSLPHAVKSSSEDEASVASSAMSDPRYDLAGLRELRRLALANVEKVRHELEQQKQVTQVTSKRQHTSPGLSTSSGGHRNTHHGGKDAAPMRRLTLMARTAHQATEEAELAALAKQQEEQEMAKKVKKSPPALGSNTLTVPAATQRRRSSLMVEHGMLAKLHNLADLAGQEASVDVLNGGTFAREAEDSKPDTKGRISFGREGLTMEEINAVLSEAEDKREALRALFGASVSGRTAPTPAGITRVLRSAVSGGNNSTALGARALVTQVLTLYFELLEKGADRDDIVAFLHSHYRQKYGISSLADVELGNFLLTVVGYVRAPGTPATFLQRVSSAEAMNVAPSLGACLSLFANLTHVYGYDPMPPSSCAAVLGTLEMLVEIVEEMCEPEALNQGGVAKNRVHMLRSIFSQVMSSPSGSRGGGISAREDQEAEDAIFIPLHFALEALAMAMSEADCGETSMQIALQCLQNAVFHKEESHTVVTDVVAASRTVLRQHVWREILSCSADGGDPVSQPAEFFSRFDVNGSGSLTAGELRKALHSLELDVGAAEMGVLEGCLRGGRGEGLPNYATFDMKPRWTSWVPLHVLLDTVALTVQVHDRSQNQSVEKILSSKGVGASLTYEQFYEIVREMKPNSAPRQALFWFQDAMDASGSEEVDRTGADDVISRAAMMRIVKRHLQPKKVANSHVDDIDWLNSYLKFLLPMV